MKAGRLLAGYAHTLMVVRYLFVAISLVGGFSLTRIWPDLQPLGVIAEPRIVLVYLLAAAAILLIATRPDELRLSRMEWICLIGFTCIHLYIGVSYFWAADPWFSANQLTDLGLMVVSLFVFCCLFRDAPFLAVNMILRVSIVLAALLGVASIATGSFGEEGVGVLGIGGIGLARLFGLAAIALLVARLSSGSILWLLPMPFLVAGIMLSGSRAALLALLPALGYVWLRRQRVGTGLRSSKLGWVGGLLALGAFVGLALTPAGMTLIAAFVISNLGSSSGGAEGGVYLADRDAIFSHAWRTFLDSPITGLGIGTYRGPFGEEYPHNLPLTYAVDAGLPALLPLLISMILFAWFALRARTSMAVAAAAVGGFILLASLFAGSYYDSRLFWFMSAVFVMGISAPMAGDPGRVAVFGVVAEMGSVTQSSVDSGVKGT